MRPSHRSEQNGPTVLITARLASRRVSMFIGVTPCAESTAAQYIRPPILKSTPVFFTVQGVASAQCTSGFVVAYTRTMIREFKQFLLRGSVVDLAVGVVIGAAFNTLINALVADLLTPLLAALVHAPNFSQLSFTIGDNVILYGNVLNALVTFLLVASALFFFVVKPMNLLISRSRKDPAIDPTTRKCPECLSEIPRDARRCAFCTTIVSA